MSANSDNLSVGRFCTTQESRPPWLFYFLTTTVSCLAYISGGMTGVKASYSMPSTTSNLIGSAILVLIGLWTVLNPYLFRLLTSEVQIQTIGFSELMFIAVSQIMANLSVGLGTGFAGVDIVTSAIFVGMLSFIPAIIPAYFMKHPLTNRLHHHAGLMSGLLLIVVGLFL